MTIPLPSRLRLALIVLASVAFLSTATLIVGIVYMTNQMEWGASTFSVGTTPYPVASPLIKDYALPPDDEEMIEIQDRYKATVTDASTVTEKKVIKTGTLSIIVTDVRASFEQLDSLAKSMGGFVELGEVYGDTESPRATVVLRIPSTRFDEASSLIQKEALATLRATVSSQDVTAPYADLDARLRSARAEEQQYLDILRRAGSIKDTLDVTARLSDVRMRIEQMDAQLRSLTGQTSFATLTIELSQEAQVRVPSGTWRPLSTLKEAAQSLVAAFQILVNYLIIAVVFLVGLVLPVVAVVYLVFRLIRWIWNLLARR